MWQTSQAHNAGVTVAVIRYSPVTLQPCADSIAWTTTVSRSSRETSHINAYLVAGPDVAVDGGDPSPSSPVYPMSFGNMANDGGHLILDRQAADAAICQHHVPARFIRPFLGSEGVHSRQAATLHLGERQRLDPKPPATLGCTIASRRYVAMRAASTRKTTYRPGRSATSYFSEVRQTGGETLLIVPSVPSESAPLSTGGIASGTAPLSADLAFALCDAPLWNLGTHFASRLHLRLDRPLSAAR